jgi:hypothetical protein
MGKSSWNAFFDPFLPKRTKTAHAVSMTQGTVFYFQTCRFMVLEPAAARSASDGLKRQRVKSGGKDPTTGSVKLAWRQGMMSLIDQIPYSILILVTVFMLLAPFYPMPHVVEKLLMLKNGALKKPVDIFDLFYHLIPLAVLILKFLRDRIQQ